MGKWRDRDPSVAECVGMTEQCACATIIAGPNILFREGLVRILSAENFRIVLTTTCIDRPSLEKLSKYESVLIVLDASEDLNAALEQIEFIKRRYPAWQVVVLDAGDQLSNAACVYRAGASAYFVKIVNPAALVKSLELVMLGEIVVPAAFLPLVLCCERHEEYGDGHGNDGANACGAGLPEEMPTTGKAAAMRRLSPREKTILRYIIEGCANKVIARKVAISEATVKVHVKSILRKIHVHSRTQAAIWGLSCDAASWATDGSPTIHGRAVAQPFAPGRALPAVPRVVSPELSLFEADVRKSS
jgi:two-component system nitrate/nitrite response regulator NarL